MNQAESQRLADACKSIREMRGLTRHNEWVVCVSFSADGQLLASGSTDKTVRLRNPDTGQEIRCLKGHKGLVYVAFSSDGRLLASGSGDNTVRLWNPNTGQELRCLQGHNGPVRSVNFSPDGRLLASGSYDKTVRLWNPETGQELRCLLGHTTEVYSVGFSPDGLLLASGSGDNTVRLWNPNTGQELRCLQGHNGPVRSVNFSPDGRLLASGSRDNTVRLWTPDKGQELRCLQGHQSTVSSVSFSPDGRLLASGSWDDTVRLWNHDTGKEFVCLRGHGKREVNSVGFSPDGRLLASGSDDGMIVLWDTSNLGIGVKPDRNAKAIKLTPASVACLAKHVATLPLAHARLRHDAPAVWMRHGSTLGLAAPLALVADLGAAVGTPKEALKLARPEHLTAEVRTDHYLEFLQRITQHPLVRRISTWQLNDACLGVVVARLLADCEFPAGYALPTGEERVWFTSVLSERLRQADPAEIWRQTEPQERLELEQLLSGRTLSRILANLQTLRLEELQLLRQYGPSLAGTPDPRELADCFQLLGLPENIRRSLSQVLRLVPRISRRVSSNHGQLYALGGYAGLSNKGNLDSLLPSELAYPHDMLRHRLLNHESLYYTRESEKEKRRELVYVVTQMGLEIQGDADVLARSLTLALAQTLQPRGYTVRHSFLGSECRDSPSLDKPSGLQHLLYYRDEEGLDERAMLEAVLRRLRSWREEFQRITVYWVIGENLPDDLVDRRLWDALRQQARHEAWLISAGWGRAMGDRMFDRSQEVDWSVVWR